METYKNKAIASMVLGIISVFFGIVFGWTMVCAIIGLVCGIIALVFGIQVRKAGEAEGFVPNSQAKAGFILGIIGVIGSAVFFLACTVVVGALGCAAATYPW